MLSTSVRSYFGNPVATLLCNPFQISLAKTETTTIPGGRTASKTPIPPFHHPRALGRIFPLSLQQPRASSLSRRLSQTWTPSLSPHQCAILLSLQPPNAPAYPTSTSVSATFHQLPHSPSIPIHFVLSISQQEQRKMSSAAKPAQSFSRQVCRTSCLLAHF